MERYKILVELHGVHPDIAFEAWQHAFGLTGDSMRDADNPVNPHHLFIHVSYYVEHVFGVESAVVEAIRELVLDWAALAREGDGSEAVKEAEKIGAPAEWPAWCLCVDDCNLI